MFDPRSVPGEKAKLHVFFVSREVARAILPVLALSLAVISLTGCSTESITSDAARAMSTPGMGVEKFAQQNRSDLIGVGDQLQLTVLGYPEFNTTTNVKASGSITIPLVGEVKAVGLSKDSLQNEIVLKLSEYVKSKVFVTLNLLSTTVQNIIVLGAVGSQNSYPNTAPISIFQLLANAGGPSADADLRHIKLYRNGDLNKEREIDLSGIVNAGNKGEMSIPMINPGDMVYVPKSENFLRAFSPFVSDTLILLTLFSLIK